MSNKQTHARPYPDLLTWRRAQALNQRDAAKFLGVSQTLYSRWERRVQHLRGRQAGPIMRRTGVPLEILVGADR